MTTAKKPFRKKYLVTETEKIIFGSQEELNKYLSDNNVTTDELDFVTKKVFDDTEIEKEHLVDEDEESSNEITLTEEEVPKQEFSDENLPSPLNVKHKKTGKPFTVSRKYFLENQGELELA